MWEFLPSLAVPNSTQFLPLPPPICGAHPLELIDIAYTGGLHYCGNVPISDDVCQLWYKNSLAAWIEVWWVCLLSNKIHIQKLLSFLHWLLSTYAMLHDILPNWPFCVVCVPNLEVGRGGGGVH